MKKPFEFTDKYIGLLKDTIILLCENIMEDKMSRDKLKTYAETPSFSLFQP